MLKNTDNGVIFTIKAFIDGMNQVFNIIGTYDKNKLILSYSPIGDIEINLPSVIDKEDFNQLTNICKQYKDKLYVR